MTEQWKQNLNEVAREEKVSVLSHFFKTGKGEYGEGDIFIGITVHDNRKVARRYHDAPAGAVTEMLYSPIHEYRLSALLALVESFKKSKRNEERQREIVDLYLANLTRANNWDLIDLSAPYILGEWLFSHPGELEIIHRLSDSENLWEQRAAIVATMTLIRHGIYDPTFAISEKYLSHPHPLIHKATGWMLREAGKYGCADGLAAFLDRHAAAMPRTMLRYAIERLSPEQRKYYMSIR